LFSHSRTSYKFPLANDFYQHGPQLEVTIGGGPRSIFQVDTGSAGVLAGCRQIGPYVCKTNQKFEFGYSSSRRYYSGIWAVACIDLQSTKKDETATASTRPMWFRLALKKWQLDHEGKEINVVINPDEHMMGVGFDRGEKPDTPPPGPINPFLLLKEMCAGVMTPGYILTTTYIQIGITKESTQGFDIVQLVRSNPDSDWIAPKVKVRIPSAGISFDATLLVDTGLGYAIVQAPHGADPKLTSDKPPRVEDGQTIKLSTLEPAETFYKFVVGDTSKGTAPQYVRWTHNLHKNVPFINTSRHALSEVDYLYDAKAGHLGFKRRVLV
jgi:hypothetical protein